MKLLQCRIQQCKYISDQIGISFFFYLQNEIIKAALNCLNSSLQSNLTDSYTLSLFAYTFTLAKDPQSSMLFASLKEKAIIEGSYIEA